MVFGDAAFEEVLFFFDVHHFGEPGEGVGDVAVERGEAAVDEAAVGDVVYVVFELGGVEADGSDGEAVADEFFLEADAFSHGGAEVFAEFIGPDVGVFIDEIHEQATEDFDVIGFIAQGVAEHLADAGEFVLAVEREDHAEEAVELGAFHALAEEENVLGEGLLVGGDGEVDIAAQRAAVRDDEMIFLGDGGDVFEHRFALMWIEAEGGNHVDERIGVDVFLMGVTAEHELELRGGDDAADDVEHVVADDAFGGGEIADAHLDDPTLDVGDLVRAPLLDVFLHRDVLGLPVVVFHRLIQLVGPAVFEWEDVEEHGIAAIDDFLGSVGGLGLFFIENEGASAESDGGGGGGENGGHGSEWNKGVYRESE